jgi:predicted RNA-binding protein associated with RNAse of E/G family
MTVTIRKYDWRGSFRYSWQGDVLQHDAEQIVVEAIWRGPGEPRVGEITFVQGDRFLEYYYFSRCYAIWRVAQADGRLKGWYCNIAEPVEEQAGDLVFTDLLLDVLVYPDGRYEILDRDEFTRACAEGLSPAQSARAETAVSQILERIRTGAPPFAFVRPDAAGQETT